MQGVLFLLALGSFQGLFGIINTDSRTKTISQLLIQHSCDSVECIDGVYAHHNDHATLGLPGSFPEPFEFSANSGEFRGDNPNDVPSVTGDDERARNSLYRWALEI